MQQRHLTTALAAVLAVASGTWAVDSSGAAPDADRVLVKYKAGTHAAVRHALRATGGKVHFDFGELRTIAVTVPVAALEGLKHNPHVESVEVDVPRYPMGQVVPWGVSAVQAPEAVLAGADGNGMKVCVIDSGVNAAHADFAGVALTGDSGNGHAWNVDNCGHGTHVAGTIAAADNDTGVVGVSPGRVALHIVKVFGDDTPNNCGWSYASALIDAVQRGQAAGAKIINMSLGGTASSIAERDAFTRVYQQGVLSIAAAGNDGNGTYSYPASYDSVIAVGAVDAANRRASFSQFTNQVELAAPGVGILSTLPFRSAVVDAGDRSFPSDAMIGSPENVAEAPLVAGGNCATSDAAWSGKVVLCNRDTTPFATKAIQVTAAGGVAMIVRNNFPPSFTGTLGTYAAAIPAVTVSGTDGQALLDGSLGQPVRVSSRREWPASAYGYLDGTSMATPHVAGAAALVWSAAPGKSNQQVREALDATALDLDEPGRDIRTGYGLVQAADAAAELVDGGGPAAGTAPTQLMVVGNTVKKKFHVDLLWARGDARVDVYRGGQKIMAGIDNTLSAVDRPRLRGTGALIYQVCNAGTTQCSSKASLYY